MNILAVNDDGIKAEGLYRLVETLSRAADIYVCAPHAQKSVSSHSLNIGLPLMIDEADFDNAKLAFSITGTPADCVKLGLHALKERGVEIDMLFSGINHGGNLGTDVFYSGTLGAAREGCFCKKPSVAVSVNSHHPKHFDCACELALTACQNWFGKFDYRTLITINAPNLPKEEVKGVKLTKQGPREYNEWFDIKKSEEGKTQYFYKGKPIVYTDLDSDIDVVAMQDDYAVITPLMHDLTDYIFLEEMKKWRIEK